MIYLCSIYHKHTRIHTNVCFNRLHKHTLYSFNYSESSLGEFSKPAKSGAGIRPLDKAYSIRAK